MPRWRQYWVLTKPRVTQLAVFCAVIGMFLATPGMVPYPVLIGGIVGIWLLAGAAFAVNCLIEQVVDAKMKRTAWRPSATGEVTPSHIIIFSIVLGSLGMLILWKFCNPLTMWLTVATFVGYAVIYTWLLKPATPQNIVIGGIVGIWLLAGAAFAVNCLIEQVVDAKMKRTAWRPSATGEVTPSHIIIFSIVLGSLGMLILWKFCNPLTMWLTVATFVGYAVIYTWLLKPATPQNIVIGGLSGAMPPALGWAAVTNSLSAEAWLLVLIIFVWTPPHFWALALYRRDDYVQSGLPMLPVTHGERFTLLNILLYTLILIAATLLPYIYGMSGLLYLISAIILGLIFLAYVIALFVSYSDALAKKTFRFSITYLSLLFAALLIDHYFI